MMTILKIIGVLFILAVVIALLMALSRDYYDYKLADMNAGYTLPDWSIWGAFLRIIEKKPIP